MWATALDSLCCPERNERVVPSSQFRVAQEPGNQSPLMFELWIRKTVKPAWHFTQGLLDLVECFLSGH